MCFSHPQSPARAEAGTGSKGKGEELGRATGPHHRWSGGKGAWLRMENQGQGQEPFRKSDLDGVARGDMTTPGAEWWSQTHMSMADLQRWYTASFGKGEVMEVIKLELVR